MADKTIPNLTAAAAFSAADLFAMHQGGTEAVKGSGSQLAEFIRDTIGATLFQGTGVTITPDDASEIITIAATAGGAGVSLTSQDLQFFGDGTDGNVTITTGTTVLARDMFYNNLTLSGTGKISLNGYRLHVAGILDLSAAPADCILAKYTAAGISDGTSASTSNPGDPANAFTRGWLVQNGTAGGGAQGQLTNGISGNPAYPYQPSGEAVSSGLGSQSNGIVGASGAGGTGTASTATAANPYTIDARKYLHRLRIDYFREPMKAAPSIGGSGGNGGGGDGTNRGGGGGGGGNGGGFAAVYARTINRSASTGARAINADGGNGGNGGTPTAGNAGGGSGGGAGGGGVIYLVYRFLTGAASTNTLSASGGLPGLSGNGVGTGTGANGTAGSDGGTITTIDLTTGTLTFVSGTTPTAGGAASGTTAGTGGASGSTTLSL